MKYVTFGSETLSHLALKTWELFPAEIKKVKLVACFKRAIKKLETNELPLSSMLDICFSGWFHVIYFMTHLKPVLPFYHISLLFFL